ncbi:MULTISPECIES: hypothetical protein [unclassified Rathayibacter]|jgi:hypothetical protein|uniref:hypothetical protein n=1 Tax=unclassified Rathayibacter TaxID=2609250 RepID=UPI0007039231|nr:MULTISPECIES: hypothetical protein [unclassified Rathayibacter]KQQ08727.1 hypothetical protein ASF46_15870 [Rathayibacter sp. Leaf296]
MSATDGPQDNPQNHDTVDDAGVDKPSQAEGDDAQIGNGQGGDAQSTAEDVTTAVDDDDLDAGVSEPTD